MWWHVPSWMLMLSICKYSVFFQMMLLHIAPFCKKKRPRVLPFGIIV